tara:strand:+ start:132 stop:668 length:537 start_codon:yes stop_codon:yes gene_type:complete
MAESIKEYDDHELAADIAKGELTTQHIAIKHGLSQRQVLNIARGHSRKEVGEIIDQLGDAYISEARRIFKGRARWLAARLLELAKQKQNLKVALYATLKALDLATVPPLEGMTSDERRQTIEIILSAGDNGDPLARKLRGVHRPRQLPTTEVIDIEPADKGESDGLGETGLSDGPSAS